MLNAKRPAGVTNLQGMSGERRKDLLDLIGCRFSGWARAVKAESHLNK